MSEESTSDIYEETGESDSEDVYTYFPFIKVENDGSVYIDGQPSSQDASEMSIESAEVLVLPYQGLVDKLETMEDNDNEEQYTQVIEEVPETTIIEAAIVDCEDTEDVPDNHLHDHNYQEGAKTADDYDEEKTTGFSYIVQQLEHYRNSCNMCEKSFNTPASLKRHLRTHTGERPFQCQICEKYFSQQSNLWKHVRTHTGERPFECPHCNKKFSQRANMKKHMIIHTGERPFVCFLCGRGFTQQANLSKHMRLHTGEKPFGCSYCDKRFTQRSNLQKHEHLHEGIKPYTCEVCFQAFTQQSNLRKHEMMHNNIKKFICDVCNKGYVQKISLMKHKQRCGVTEVKLVSLEDVDSNDQIITDQVKLIKTYSPEVQCLEEYEGGIIIQTDSNYIFTTE